MKFDRKNEDRERAEKYLFLVYRASLYARYKARKWSVSVLAEYSDKPSLVYRAKFTASAVCEGLLESFTGRVERMAENAGLLENVVRHARTPKTKPSSR